MHSDIVGTRDSSRVACMDDQLPVNVKQYTVNFRSMYTKFCTLTKSTELENYNLKDPKRIEMQCTLEIITMLL